MPPSCRCLSFPLCIAGAIAVLCSGEVGEPRFQDVGLWTMGGGMLLGDMLADG